MKGSRLGKGRGGSFFEEPEQNPMDGVANLVDAMLVLACGLMMALVSFYKVDLKGTSTVNTQELKQEQLKEVEDYGVIDQEGNISGGFESRGQVYEDKKTGKLYIITPDTSDTSSEAKEDADTKENTNSTETK